MSGNPATTDYDAARHDLILRSPEGASKDDPESA